MRRTLHVLVAVTSVLTAATPALAEATPSRSAPAPSAAAEDDAWYVEHLLHEIRLTDFVALAAAGDGWFDMSTDFCTAPLVGTTGRSFDFHDACRRHDFGYRNLKLLDRRYHCADRPPDRVCSSPGRHGRFWNASSRARADRRFLADMRGHCAARPWYEEATCRGWAETFYRAVRVAGGP